MRLSGGAYRACFCYQYWFIRMVTYSRVRAVTAVASWMACSTSLIFFNRLILKQLAFQYPIFLTFAQVTMISLSLFLWYSVVQKNATSPYRSISRQYVVYMLPIAFMSSFTIVLRNFIYFYLSVATMQLVASAAPVVVYAIAVVSGMESYNSDIVISVCCVCAGVSIAVYSPVSGRWQGIAMQIIAMTTDAVRGVHLKRFLNISEASYGALDVLYLMAPASAILLYIPASSLEFGGVLEYTDNNGYVVHAFILLNALLAGLLNLASIWMLKEVSVLTSSLSAVTKDILIIVCSLILGDGHMSLTNGLGWATSVVGLFWYAYIRSRQSMAK